MSNARRFDSNPFKSLPCVFPNLLYSQKFSDFTLIVPNPPPDKPARVPVHRFLLDAYSNYFHNFFTEMPSETEVTVCFPDWAAPAVYTVLEHVYSANMILFTDTNIAQIYRVAAAWDITSLKHRCSTFLELSVSPTASLTVLSKLAGILTEQSAAMQNLLHLVTSNFAYFDPALFAPLPFPIFDNITEVIYSSRPEDKLAASLCLAIEHFILANIDRIGCTEFDKLLKKYTMKTYPPGIVKLYKLALPFNWSIKLCENKILHTWRHLPSDELAKLPINRLHSMLKQNYLNAQNEDSLYDFVLKVQREHPNEDCSVLFGELRLDSFSPMYREEFFKNDSIPEHIKEKHLNTPRTVTRRLPRAETKCLIIGACDELSLNDVRDMLVQSWFTDSNIDTVRGDKPFTADFRDYHSILVFGFYKFYDVEKLSRALYDYGNDGGGIVIAYGAHRPDEFGLGPPISNKFPVDMYKMENNSGSKDHNLIFDSDDKGEGIGCRHLRMLCNPTDDATVDAVWTDGVPFVVKRSRTDDQGGMVIFNASPVSADIIPEQWDKNDKSMIRLLANAIVSVANIVFSRRSNRHAK